VGLLLGYKEPSSTKNKKIINEDKVKPKSNITSNKFLFKKFRTLYNEEVNKIFISDGDNNNKLNFNQLIVFLQNVP
jgi:hypothetical protein